MKKLFLLSALLFTGLILKSQQITLVKDLLISGLPTDSMYYMDDQKIIPFKDSGIVQVGYADSLSAGQNPSWRIRVSAFDKNLNLLWSLKMELNQITARIAACTDDKNNIYVTYLSGNNFNLLKISATGQIIFNKVIDAQISSNVTVFNRIAWYNGSVAVLGSIFISQISFAPFIAMFNPDGTLRRKHVFPASSSSSYKGLYNCSNLSITQENNLAFTFQLDASSNYKVVCYDSLLKEVWNKTFSVSLGFNNNLFSQGGFVTFINFDSQSTKVAFFKYDSKTGAGGTKTETTYLFSSVFNVLALPTKNGKFLAFGNYGTTGGFDNAIDYFDNEQVLASVMSNTNDSRNRVSDACYIGNTLYTVAIRFADQYCDQSNGIYRGCLWIKKFNTDFLTQNMRLTDNKTNRVNTVYPNPFSNEITIETSADLNSIIIKLYNEMGQKITTTYDVRGQQLILDTHALSAGCYFIQVLNQTNGTSSFEKLIKL